jgi:outer membrane protein OmpA-like peptidoglycan-associated protein
MIFYRFIGTLSLCIAITFASAQMTAPYTTMETAKGKLKKHYQSALQYGRSGDYERAIRELEKVLNAEPHFIDAYITMGAVYDELGMHEKAEGNFERVIEIDPNYEPHVWYRLALLETEQDKYPEAEQHLKRFLETNPESVRIRRQAEEHLEKVRFRAEAMRNPVPFEPQSLGPNINTSASEYLPSFTADGEFLIYTGRVNDQEDFFISQKKNGTWQPGKPMEDINTPLNEGAQTISADGQLLVFTACNRRDGYGSCDLYYSERRGDRWTRPANIGRPVNSAAWESQPSLSANGRALYFSSNRQGTRGGRDLWISIRQHDGSWGEPENLGSPINTSENDESPFIHPDGRSLYFMSKGHPGMGGFDLFLVRRKEDGTWSEPQNLGYPINTKGNEGALVVSLDGRTGYFASDRLKEGKPATENRTTTDLYQFELYPEARPDPVTYVKAVVLDANSRLPLTAEVEFVDLSINEIHTAATTDSEGSFLVALPLGKDYALNVSRKGYLFHSENFALADKTSIDAPYLLEIELSPIPKNISSGEIAIAKPVVLRNVFFETGSAELKPASVVELNHLKKLLENNPDMKIRINGHTDNVGSDEDNQLLSQNRAKAVYDYLIGQSIRPDRLQYRGFGESRPIASNDTPEGRRQNRRTEFEVVD